MIHVLNYSENIIDDLSFKQDAIYDANHVINIQETMETFDFEVSSKIAQNLRDRHRLIIQDHMGIYREFIIENIIDLESGVTEIQANASYLDDIKTAKPVKPHSFKNQPPTVMMEYLLADTGWEVSPETEVPMNADFSWDKVTDRLELLKELQDVFNMRLLFYVVVGKNNIEKRYVKLVEVNPMFNGEEIDYKENLIGLKREIDYSEVVTALLGVGPEDSETKKRLYVEVTDDKAQEQFGLPQRYIWDYYEVQVDSETKVTSELIKKETLKELERRKQAVVTYDISSTDIDAQVGDMIRVKDEDFNPEIYLEAEIVEIHYNLLNNVKEYKFGVLREFTREQVYSQYEKFRKELEERLKEIVSNTDSIISERLEEELKYVERYIEKSPTPPLSPKEGDLWLDTSDPKVAILKRYENGKWVKSSVDSVKDIGGMTREETLYDRLKERMNIVPLDYSDRYNRYSTLTNDRYYHYVDQELKTELNSALSQLTQAYQVLTDSFNAINSESPTIGAIVYAQNKDVDFRTQLHSFDAVYDKVRKAYDDYMLILQSQYSDEKYNEAMEKVATELGGHFDGTNIIADVPLKKDLDDLNNEIKKYLSGEINTLNTELGKKVENILINTKEEIRLGIESVEKKIDGIEIGGRNLLAFSIGVIKEIGNSILFGSSVEANLPAEVKSVTLSIWNPSHVGVYNISGFLAHDGSETSTSLDNIAIEKFPKSKTFKPSIEDANITHATFTIENMTLEQFKDAKFKLEIGTVATHWTPAPEDLTNAITKVEGELSDYKEVVEGSFKDGLISEAEAKAIAQQKLSLESEKKSLDAQYKTLSENSALKGTTALTNLNSAKTQYDSSYNALITSVNEAIKDMKVTIQESDLVKSNFEAYSARLGVLSQRLEEASDALSTSKVDSVEIGGRNYIKDSKIIPMTPADSGARDNTEHINTDEYIEIKANKDFQSYWYRYYVLSTNNKITDESIFVYDTDYQTFGIDVLTESDNFAMYINQRHTNHSNSYSSDTIALPNTNGKWQRIFISLPLKKDGLQRSAFYVFVTGGKSSNPNAFLANDYIRLKNSKLEKGNKGSSWTPAPEDMENEISNINQTITKHDTSIGVLENEISLKANSTAVTQQLNTALKPIKTDVQANKSELVLQKGLIEQRVSKTDYTTDMNGVVTRLSSSEGKISNLEKEIKLKVTETDVQKKIDELEIGGRNLVLNTGMSEVWSPYTSTVSTSLSDDGVIATWNRTGQSAMRSPVTVEMEQGKEYTLTFEARGTIPALNLFILTSPTPNISFHNELTDDISSDFKKFVVTFVFNSPRKSVYLFIGGSSSSTTGQWLEVKKNSVKLEKGNKATDWTPAPEDMEDRVKKAEGSITVNSDAIKQKVSYTEINKTNKTLERVISELIVDTRGISYQYDVNGMIQGFTLNSSYFKLNHNLIDINNGDVLIQNGKTTIKDAFINNLAGNTAFINSLTGKTAFINKIKAIDINAENIRVGFNKIAGSLQVTSTGLQMYDGKNKTMQLDDRGSTFWSGTRLIGRIGSSYLTNDNTVKTLRFALDDPNSMMSWEYKENSSDTNYQMMLQYSPKVQKGHDKRGFIFNDDVSMVPSRALQLSYIRPLNYTGTGNRVYLSTWTWRGTRGVSMLGGNENGSGVWFGNNVVALFANTSGKAGQGDLDIASDSRSYFVRSESIFDRDYGYSANVYITSNGILGRSTSARKYKAFIELQHETEEKQLEHSKKILQLKPKTWYSKSLLEAVAKEIETGEVDSADDFKIERQFGMIADEFEEVGLTELVQYGKDDEVEGLAYDRISVHHNVLIKDLYDENDSLKDKINELENKLNMIMEKIK